MSFPSPFGEGGERQRDGGASRVQALNLHSDPHFPTPIALRSAPPHEGEGRW